MNYNIKCLHILLLYWSFSSVLAIYTLNELISTRSGWLRSFLGESGTVVVLQASNQSHTEQKHGDSVQNDVRVQLFMNQFSVVHLRETENRNLVKY